MAVAALFVAMWSPAALLAGPAGLLADTWSPRRLLILSSLAAAALSGGLAFADGLALILALVALMGCLNAIAMPAEFALLPLVAGERRDRARQRPGRVRALRRLHPRPGRGRRCSPRPAARRSRCSPTPGRSLVLAAVAAAMRIDWAPHAHAARERMRDGIDFLARDRELAPVVGIVFVSLLLMTATPAAALFFADENLHMGGAGFGILMATWGAGMALGALVVAPRFRRGAMACAGGRRGRGAGPRASRCRRCGRWCGWRSPATCSAASRTGRRTCSRAR